MTETSENPKRTVPRKFKILLGLSLALNLAVAGVVVGAFVRNGPHGGPHGGSSKGPRSAGQINYAMPYLSALPREDRRALFEAARGQGKQPGHAQRRALYQDMIAALEAEVFDRVAVEAVLKNQADATLQIQADTQAEWVNVIEAMSFDERRAYAAKVKEILSRIPKRKKR